MSQSQIKININDNKLSFLLCIVLFLPNINYYLNNILFNIGFSSISVYSYILIYLVVIILYAYSITKSPLSLLMLSGLVLLYSITLFFWPENQVYMFGELFDGVYNPLYRILIGFPLLFVPVLIKDENVLYNYIKKFAYVNTIIAIITYVWIILIKGANFEYMTFAYNMAFSSFICCVDAFKSRNIIKKVIVIFSLFSILIVGSRGAAVSVVVFVVFYFIFLRNKTFSRNQIITFTLIILFLALFLILNNNIMLWLRDFLSQIGFNSRSINKLIEGTLFYDEGRSNIAATVWEAIKQRPVVGNGIFGDRVALATSPYGKGTYAHNLFLELLCQYGVLLGGVLIILYLFNSIKALFIKKCIKLHYIYICSFSAIFFKLMVTGTYLGDFGFWFFIGMIYKVIKNHKQPLNCPNILTRASVEDPIKQSRK